MPAPNQPTAKGISLLAPYWTSILAARQQGFSPQELWSVVNDVFQEGGPDYQGASIHDMYHYWVRSGEYLNAGAAFGAEPEANPVTGEMWAWAPWAAPSTTDWLVPNYMLNYARGALDGEGNLLLDSDGNPIPVYGAHLSDGPLPDLVGDVNSLVEQSSQMSVDTGSPRTVAALAGMGGVGLGPILSVNIMRV